MNEFLLFTEDRRKVVCEQAQDKLGLLDPEKNV